MKNAEKDLSNNNDNKDFLLINQFNSDNILDFNEMKNLDPDIIELVDEYFWDLI
jgi:hypothetical protein